MTDVADPNRRNNDDVSIVPDVDDVTQLDERDSDGTALDDDAPRDEDADLYTQTVKAPGVGDDEGTSLGDENTPVTPHEQEHAGGNLEHGLGNPGGASYDRTLEEGTEFGLGADNTQDTPPVPERDEPDPLRHGLESAE